jgi:predicted AAA+ superfamily ATPase
VGKVNFLYLYPLTFLEFLDAVNQSGLRQLIENTTEFKPYPELFHRELIELLRTYYFIGGMPEAVQHFSETNNFLKVREIQKEIINSYVLDFAKHTPTQDIPKLSLIWESIPVHLGKENKKFLFSALKKSARAREYENALKWLEDTGLIIQVNLLKSPKIPLTAYSDKSIFKIYALDVGLLGALSRISPDILTQGNQLFQEFKGSFVENYVAQQLTSHEETELYYWKSDGSAEIDFICAHKNSIFPLEAKAGISPTSKSLLFYDKKYNPDILSRATLLNLKHDGKVCNYPLYAISLFPELLVKPVNEQFFA